MELVEDGVKCVLMLKILFIFLLVPTYAPPKVPAGYTEKLYVAVLKLIEGGSRKTFEKTIPKSKLKLVYDVQRSSTNVHPEFEAASFTLAYYGIEPHQNIHEIYDQYINVINSQPKKNKGVIQEGSHIPDYVGYLALKDNDPHLFKLLLDIPVDRTIEDCRHDYILKAWKHNKALLFASAASLNEQKVIAQNLEDTCEAPSNKKIFKSRSQEYEKQFQLMLKKESRWHNRIQAIKTYFHKYVKIASNIVFDSNPKFTEKTISNLAERLLQGGDLESKTLKRLKLYNRDQLIVTLQQLRSQSRPEIEERYKYTYALAYFSKEVHHEIRRLIYHCEGDRLSGNLVSLYKYHKDLWILEQILQMKGDGALAEGLEFDDLNLALYNTIDTFKVISHNKGAFNNVAGSLASNNKTLNHYYKIIRNNLGNNVFKYRLTLSKLFARARKIFKKMSADNGG